MPPQLILVSSPELTAQAAAVGLPLLRLGLGITSNGSLRRSLLNPPQLRDLLGLSDCGIQTAPTEAVCRAILQEAADCCGILADFERSTEAVSILLHRLDELCTERNLPLLVPIGQAIHAPHAFPLTEAAASSGDLRTHLQQIHEKFGRIAVFLAPLARRFRLPAADPEGETLSSDALEALRQRIQAQVFFSHELCARYFTYMEGSDAYFVLFDDEQTLQARCDLAVSCGAKFVLAEYPAGKRLFIRS